MLIEGGTSEEHHVDYFTVNWQAPSVCAEPEIFLVNPPETTPYYYYDFNESWITIPIPEISVTDPDCWTIGGGQVADDEGEVVP